MGRCDCAAATFWPPTAACSPFLFLADTPAHTGIIPGFGGTARLPRLVGLEKGLTMMLRSKNIKARPQGGVSLAHALVAGSDTRRFVGAQAEEALKSGLVDVVVAKPEDLLPTAKALALDIANGVKPKVQALKKADKLPNMMARRGGGKG